MIETPYPFQLAGAQWLAKMPQAFLADEMGLGKSCQAVRAADIVGADHILVICPANCRPNWRREFNRFSPLDRPLQIIDTGKDAIQQHGVVVISYDLATNLHKDLKNHTWDLIILDEAHFLKERSAKRTRAIYGRGPKAPGIIASGTRVWRLSGTPAPNDASELWTHLAYAKTVAESYWDFVFHFCTGFDSSFGFKITGSKNIPELRKILSTVMLRRTKEEVLKDLPPLRFDMVEVPASPVDPAEWEQPAAKAALTEMEMRLRKALEGAGTQDQQVALLDSLQQNMASLRRFVAMSKLPATLDILEDELQRDPTLKLVVFGIHRAVIEAAERRLARFGAVSLYGKTPSKQRQANIDRFVTDDNHRVFIGNITAAGTGVDGLQKASCEICFLEQTWVPAENLQAIMRVHRNLQERPVRARIFMLPNSVDQQVQATLVRKASDLAKFI